MITVMDGITNDTVEAKRAPTSSSSASAAIPQASTSGTAANAAATAKQEQPSSIMGISIEAQTKKTNSNLPSPLPDTSNLMSRLQMFLPQMKSANQELLSNPFPVPPSGMLGVGIGSDPVRLDANLKLDEDSDSDSDDDSNDEGSKSNHPLIREVGADDVPERTENDEPSNMTPNDANDNAVVPTIQLEFTLGDMSGNPLMKLLADDDDSDDDDSTDTSKAGKDADDDPMSTARENAVANLLLQPPTTPSKNNSTLGSNEKKSNNNTLVLLDSSIAGGGSNKNAGKKPLITELS